jgi:hypothetical protein
VKVGAFNDKNRDNKRHNTGKPFVPGVKVEVYFSILIIATVLALGLTEGNNGVTTHTPPFSNRYGPQALFHFIMPLDAAAFDTGSSGGLNQNKERDHCTPQSVRKKTIEGLGVNFWQKEIK